MDKGVQSLAIRVAQRPPLLGIALHPLSLLRRLLIRSRFSVQVGRVVEFLTMRRPGFISRTARLDVGLSLQIGDRSSKLFHLIAQRGRRLGDAARWSVHTNSPLEGNRAHRRAFLTWWQRRVPFTSPKCMIYIKNVSTLWNRLQVGCVGKAPIGASGYRLRMGPRKLRQRRA